MSIITKFLVPLLFFGISTFQKTYDKCLIIHLNDTDEFYKITTIAGDLNTRYYLILNYPNISEGKKKELSTGSTKDRRKKEELNAILSTGVQMNDHTSTSYNLQNREEVKNLPYAISECDCANVNSSNLGMEFKVYVEKENSWITYDAKKLLVEE